VSWGLRTAVVPWVVARLVVGGALAAAHEIVVQGKPTAAVATRVHEGLLGWDAGWYETIARHGYAGAGHMSLRFFPLVPLLTRAVSYVPGVGFGAALVVVANASSLVGVALLALLARRETGDAALARRAAWLVCLAPAAFTQVMGYAEGTLLALSVGTMLALRARSWWWAAVLGLAAGATRPLGVLLVVPALIEAVRGWRGAGAGGRVGRSAAMVGPVIGFGAFLGWVGWRYGDALAPLRVQQQGTLRGGIADPLRTLAHDASLLAHGRHLGSALHLPWALLALALVVVALRRWPLAYGAFAAAVLVVALTASNLDGFERYALSAFPLVLAGASLTSGPRVERVVLTLAAAGLGLYALLAFTNLYVP
jgi:Mannosyltransferase (PIG-V)